MPAHPSAAPGKELPAIARPLVTGAVALVVTGACWAWAVFAVARTARQPVAWGGGGAAVVIVAAVTMAAYYAQVAHRTRNRVSSAELETERLEREFSQLARETLPALVRRVRGGTEPAAVLAGTSGQVPGVMRGLLDTVINEVAAAERQAAAATAEHAVLDAAVTLLADETLPAAIRQLRAGEPADVVLAGTACPDNKALRGILATVAEEVAVAGRQGAAAMAACASAAARIQAQTTRMLAELREMENRHGGEEKVFADLMELDHRVSQMGRLADSIALLAGGRSGRRWTKPIPMESILRGAMGRIDAYQRIRLHSISTAAVVGYAAEGVMHALAELMDNAAAFSAHGSEVHVYLEEEDVGVVITIEDSGLGMRKRERNRAEGLISQSLDLATLPGTRLGLAVVGRVAGRYGLNVNFRPSSRGGTGVVVMIPRQLIAQPREHADGAEPRGNVAEADQSAGSDQSAGFAYPDESSTAAVDDSDSGAGLPVRPRGRTLAASMPRQETAAAPPARQSRDPGSRFAAFREAGERPRSGPAEPEGKTT